jgi:alanyl-tRNA synthetase
VLRRILRRASRFARLLGQKEPFICRLVQVLSETMGDAFPEIRERRDFVTEVIRSEEDRFIRTLDAGLDRFDKIVAELGTRKVVPGDKVFVLYDTYGFPPDLTRILAEEKGLTTDEPGFEKCMEEQKTRARAAQKQGINTMGTEGWTTFSEGSTRFVGYELSGCETKVLRYREDKGVLSIVLETTPFYAEMGGEVGEKGTLLSDGLELSVFDTIKVNDTVIHRGKVVKGVADETSMGKVFSHP